MHDPTTPRAGAQTGTPPALRLIAEGGLSFFTKGGAVVGRSPTADFVVADPGVSRRHIEFETDKRQPLSGYFTVQTAM